MKRLKSGFTLVEIMIVVAIIALLAVIAIPSFASARVRAQRTACINNLRQIDGAKDQWALDNNQPPTATPDWGDLIGVTEGYIKSMPQCPAGGGDQTYDIGDLTTNPSCSAVADHVLPAAAAP